jgi:manganese oxidase
MTEMEMPIPEDTAPMMPGVGAFGSVEMGGMVSMVKVRKDQKPGDYKDPDWYKHSPGELAFEWTGLLPNPARFASEGGKTMPIERMPAKSIEVQVKKPKGQSGHARH